MPREKTAKAGRVLVSPGEIEFSEGQEQMLLEREGLLLGRKGGVSAAHFGEKQRIPDSGTGTKIKNCGGV